MLSTQHVLVVTAVTQMFGLHICGEVEISRILVRVYVSGYAAWRPSMYPCLLMFLTQWNPIEEKSDCPVGMA
jgi:hypothetical protein